MLELIAPLFVAVAVSGALIKGEDSYSVFLSGAKSGLETVVKILPAMLAVMSASAMLRESGLINALANLIAKWVSGDVPEDIITLAILRPVSGAGSTGLLAEILASNGPDSFAGRVASVIAAASETTLYVLTVYFSATRVKYTKRILIAALLGDFVCVLTATILCRMFF